MNHNIEEQLKQDGVFVSTTVGSSMRPMLRNRRDRIVLRSCDPATLKKGDLPLYRYPDGKYVLHRILAVKDGYFIIRGDNTYQKERIPFEWVLGYVTEFYRGNKHVLSSNRGYRFYASFWQGVYFLRLPLYKAYRLAAGIKHRLFDRKK